MENIIFIEDPKWEEHRDTLSKNRSFDSEEKANEYIDSHPRPNDLEVTIDKKYEKRKLEQLEEKKKIEEIHIRTLELISLHNHTSVIAKVLNVSRNEFKKILEILEFNHLIKNCGRNWLDKYSADRYEITPQGEAKLKEVNII